jgi:hypothetical protein
MHKIALPSFLLMGIFMAQHVSAEMTYSPTLPQFGGGNGQALGIVQFEKQQIDARAARAASALAALEREANRTVTTDADRLISTITNFLNVEIARQFSTEILSGDAPSGTISVGDVSIGYLRSDGFLSLEINDGNGITTIELPVVE